MRQCELAGVSRATVYARQQPKVDSADDLQLCRLIDEEYTRHPITAAAGWPCICATRAIR